MQDFITYDECKKSGGKEMRTWETLLNLFEACYNGKSVARLHGILLKSGLIRDGFFSSKLLHLYGIYSPLGTVRKLFGEMSLRTAYAWNSMIKRCCKEKQYKEALGLFSLMLSFENCDRFTVPIVLKACSGSRAFQFGRTVHGFVKKTDYSNSNLFVGSGLIEFYSKCGYMNDAFCVFEEYRDNPDVVLWTNLITGYEQNCKPKEALHIAHRMVCESSLVPDSITLVSIVSAYAQLLDLNSGRSVHGFMIRRELDGDLSLLNALLNLYAKSGSVMAAANLFTGMVEKDIISWGCMISCFAYNGAANAALELLDEMMIVRGIQPNSVIVISALHACEATGNLEVGRKMHKLAVSRDLESDMLVATALIDMYMSCNSPNEAVHVFENMPEKDAISWSAMINGYVRNGSLHKSMGIFQDMLNNNTRPDHILIVKILTACSEMGILQLAYCLHGYLIRGGFDNNSFVGASLIESYAKCGSLEDAVKVFCGIKDRDVVIWSCMFAGYGYHGQGKEAVKLFDEMIKNSTIFPNNVTFLSILSACSHAGLLEEGIKLFNEMVNVYKLTPEAKHYSTMVDLVARNGDMEKAMGIMNEIPFPVEDGHALWGALLGGSRIHQNVEIGEVAAKNLFQLEPEHAGYYILLSNMYAVDGKWSVAAELRNIIWQKQLKKMSGQSSIKDEVHSLTKGHCFQ